MRWKILLGLCFSYFMYLLIGGAVFSAIERPSEEDQCQQVQEAVSDLFEKIRNASINSEDLRNLTQLLQTAASYGVQIDENFNVTCTINWDFQSAFFFSGTVVTTIGYGHIAPVTKLGRSICIIYAIIGIPLFGLMFSGLGEKIAGLVKSLDARIRGTEKRTWVRRLVLIFIVLSALLVLCLLVPAAIFMSVEEWTYHDSFYYAFITLTTIGFGDLVVGINPDITYVALYRVMVYIWILFGMAFMATVITLISDFLEKTGKNARRRKMGAIRSEEVDGVGEEEHEESEVTENDGGTDETDGGTDETDGGIAEEGNVQPSDNPLNYSKL